MFSNKRVKSVRDNRHNNHDRLYDYDNFDITLMNNTRHNPISNRDPKSSTTHTKAKPTSSLTIVEPNNEHNNEPNNGINKIRILEILGIVSLIYSFIK